ncbi:MAG: DUF4129 domain-containing protein [Pyrinomonadaceae bacterium]
MICAHAHTRFGRALLGTLGLLMCAASAARAGPLKDYQTRVAQTRDVLAQLLNLYEIAADDESTLTTTQLKQEEAALLVELRAALPVTDKVEWADGALVVDNRWLQTELDALAQLPPMPDAARRTALRRIDARLHALAERLDEAANTATTPRDKADEKGRLHAILQRPEYNEGAAAGDSALTRLWQRLMHWLRGLMPAPRPVQPGTAMFASRAARFIVYALCLALIAFVLWRYGPRLLRRKLTHTSERRARVILGERLAPDETAVDLLSEAERLARSGDLRGAMRKAYIAVLCELGERKILRLAPHHTNRDYLRALRDHAGLLRTVQPLTAAYERHWYGLIPANDADWSEFQQQANEVTSDE